VIPVPFGEDRQARAVKIHAAVVDVVRVLPGADAAGAKPDLPALAVHAIDAANHPLAPGDLTLHAAGRGVVEIEVVPAVALRHPDDLPGLVQIVDELLAGVVDERPALLVADGNELARGDVEQLRPGQRDAVARLEIVVGVQLGLKLVLG